MICRQSRLMAAMMADLCRDHTLALVCRNVTPRRTKDTIIERKRDEALGLYEYH